MPAINPTRLKTRSALLAKQFADPPAFIRNLHHLLEFYADHTRRPGRSGRSAPLLKSYKVRPPVLNQILIDLTPHAQENPDIAFTLCDSLWQQNFFEFRQLCASLLGVIPTDSPQLVVDRVTKWIQSDLEEPLVNMLLYQGLTYLREEHRESVYDLIKELTSSKEVFYQKIGLRALLQALRDPDIENLPILFRIIQPFTRELPNQIYPELSDILRELARRSPNETAYFLRQMLSIPNSPDTPWLVRQSIRSFPAELQTELREAVRSVDL